MMLEESNQAAIRKLPEKLRAKKPTPPRRGYTMDKKLQVVRETLAPGASVSLVARRHDINSNIVFRWRRQYMRGELVKGAAAGTGQPQLPPAFVPVDVVDHAGTPRALPGPQRKQDASIRSCASQPLAEPGVIEIETALGMKVRLTGNVDERMLGLVLAEIGRRP